MNLTRISKNISKCVSVKRKSQKRASKLTVTLIDQMFNKLKKYKRCRLSWYHISDLSDHLQYFSILDIVKKMQHKAKFVKVNKTDKNSINIFHDYLARFLQTYAMGPNLFDDLKENYGILEKTILEANSKYLEPKTIRFSVTSTNCRLG